MKSQSKLIGFSLILAVAACLPACTTVVEKEKPVTTSTTTTESTTLRSPVGVQTTETRVRY